MFLTCYNSGCRVIYLFRGRLVMNCCYINDKTEYSHYNDVCEVKVSAVVSLIWLNVELASCSLSVCLHCSACLSGFFLKNHIEQ